MYCVVIDQTMLIAQPGGRTEVVFQNQKWWNLIVLLWYIQKFLPTSSFTVLVYNKVCYK